MTTESQITSNPIQPILLTNTIDSIGIITLNNPHRLNSLSAEVVNLILAALKDFTGKQVRVVILRTYPGAKVFSAGHDLSEIHADGTDPLNYNELFEQLLHAFRKNPVPIIGMIEGSVWGGACDVAATCDILIGTPTSTFAITPARLGIAYNIAGLSHFIGAIPVHVFKEMLFTANPISAEEAFRIGFLNHLVDPAKLEETAMEIARTIASRAPLDITMLRMEMQKLTSGTSLKADDYEEIQGMRRTVYRSSDFKEGVQAFFEKRTPVFTGK